MSKHLCLQFLFQKWLQCCFTTCSFDQLNGCSLWTPNTTKCSKKHSQASRKLRNLSISRPMLQHHFMLLMILTTKDFSKKWLRSVILVFMICKPTQTTKTLWFHEPTILYGQIQRFQCCQQLWPTNNLKCSLKRHKTSCNTGIALMP